MEKRKCEICGEMKPQNEFSKSYKHRCKACVAEAARNERQRYKNQEREIREALSKEPIVPGIEEPTTYLPNPRYVIATHAMQGILAGDKFLGFVINSMEGDLAKNIVHLSVKFADELMKKLEEKKS